MQAFGLLLFCVYFLGAVQSEPSIEISGNNYVEEGAVIRLVCKATGLDYAPDGVDWFLDGYKLSNIGDNRVTVKESRALADKSINSVLEIADAKMDDSGLYVCRSALLQITSASVRILKANQYNSKRGGMILPTRPERSTSTVKAPDSFEDQMTESGGVALHQLCTFPHLPVTLMMCVALWALRHRDLLV
ncbi:Ig heavy chain V region 441 [Aplysia californica]|uniref:Ig heavy chain V region 441 n=1 Tax=Aplysia californica TaxID=6500 RepID=A0ABM0JGK6_APLCA|nr:Ig heavy chain V region 441 [Aplysia californica]